MSQPKGKSPPVAAPFSKTLFASQQTRSFASQPETKMPRGTEQKRQRAQPGKVKARRASYDLSFKTHVVETALQRPANNRIKPTCALFPGIEPCQVRQLPGGLPPFFRAARAAPLAPYGPPRPRYLFIRRDTSSFEFPRPFNAPEA